MDRRLNIALVTHTRERKHNQELSIVKGEYLEVLYFYKRLYQIKSKLDRMYDALPSFPEAEKQWSKEELARVLKGK